VFHRRRFHRQKAYLVLSALRHRAAELGEQAEFRQVEHYAPSVRRFSGGLSVGAPTSYAARSFVTSLPICVRPARGFATGEVDFEAWVAGRGGRGLLLEDFYREARVRHDVLMDGAEPCGARWNYDADTGAATAGGRAARPSGADADTGRGRDRRGGTARPRPLASGRRCLLRRTGRPAVGGGHPTRGADAMLAGDPWLAHSLLSVPLNLGLLDPMEVVARVEAAYRAGAVPLASRRDSCGR